MARSEASEILRRHVVERRRRASTHSAILDDEPSLAMPPMSNAEFADSCLLVDGVPEVTLAMLEIWHCEDGGSTWTVDAVKIGGNLVNVPIEQIAIKLTLRESAQRVGVYISAQHAKQLYRDAMDTVTDNVVRRAANARS